MDPELYLFISTRVVLIFDGRNLEFMKNFIPTSRRSITAINAARILQQHGTEVSLEHAKLILDFLYKFAKLSAVQVIDRDSGNKTPNKKTPRNLFK